MTCRRQQKCPSKHFNQLCKRRCSRYCRGKEPRWGMAPCRTRPGGGGGGGGGDSKQGHGMLQSVARNPTWSISRPWHGKQQGLQGELQHLEEGRKCFSGSCIEIFLLRELWVVRQDLNREGQDPLRALMQVAPAHSLLGSCCCSNLGSFPASCRRSNV